MIDNEHDPLQNSNKNAKTITERIKLKGDEQGGTDMIAVTGLIVRRRSLGKNLAFADIQPQPPSNDNETSKGFDHKQSKPGSSSLKNESSSSPPLYQVAFRRASATWDKSHDDTFPTKASDLPFGAHVSMIVKMRDTTATATKGPPWEVHSWHIRGDTPKQIATEMALATTGGNGISCSTYLKSRGDIFLHVQKQYCGRKDTTTQLLEKPKKKKQPKQSSTTEQNKSPQESNGHGDKKAKALRARIFAKWLLDTFGKEYILSPSSNRSSVSSTTSTTAHKDDELKIDTPQRHLQVIGNGGDSEKVGGGHVLDVAGGRGQLSIELAIEGIPCIVIDPLLRKRGSQNISKRQLSRIQRSSARSTKDSGKDTMNPPPNMTSTRHEQEDTTRSNPPLPQHVAQFFNSQQFVNDNTLLIHQSNILVGLHPDECTEDILDVALQHGKSVAIVPCCVFPDLFPNRWFQSAKNEEYCLPCNNKDEDINNNNKPYRKKSVRTYDEFLKYLMQKDSRLQRQSLPFEGKNQVIYLKQ